MKRLKMRQKTPDCRFCECGDHAFAKASKWGITLVSMNDCGLLLLFHWVLTEPRKRKFYVRSEGFATVSFTAGYLHRAVMPHVVELLVDHRNGNGLDNRRHNLRPATYAQNGANTAARRGRASKYRGVKANKGTGRAWVAGIKSEGKQIHLGYHDTEIEAALAYDRKSVELHGEFARLNISFGHASLTEEIE